MARFFINRPIVAMVISILMVIVGSVTASVPHGTELSQTMRTGRPPRDAARSTRHAPTAA